MNLLSLFSFAIFAAESVLSHLPLNFVPPTPPPQKPAVSFSQLPIILSPTPTLPPAPSPTPSLFPTPTPRTTKKQSVTIALLGDSMMDTLGPDAPYITQTLKTIYPTTTFDVQNFGVGGTPIEFGIERVSTVALSNPDVVVLESYAYNVSGTTNQTGVDNHWLALARAVDAIKQTIPDAKIVIAATIAPNRERFGDGAPGLSFSLEDKIVRTNMIKKYLETTIQFAQGEHIPLADSYHASLDSTGNGKRALISFSDHIHYSDAGRKLFSQKIAQSIVANKLLE